MNIGEGTGAFPDPDEQERERRLREAAAGYNRHAADANSLDDTDQPVDDGAELDRLIAEQDDEARRQAALEMSEIDVGLDIDAEL